MKYINIPIFIPHAGCPFQCIFCSQQHIVNQVAVPTVREVKQQIDTYLPTIASDAEVEVAFFGGSFTALPMDVQAGYLEAAAAYLRRGLINGIRLSTRPDCIDPTVLDLLRTYGVTTIELGVQSMHESVLAASQRGYSPSEVIEASRLIKQYGFGLGIQLMVGLPDDTYERALFSAQAAVKMQADMVRIYPTLVLADTPLARWWQEGRYQPLLLEDAINICADMLMIFQYCHIPVIRMGLQPNQELCEPGTVLAGPLHPGFGELVEQHIFFEQAESLLSDLPKSGMGSGEWRLQVHFRDLSKMIGHRQSNLKSLARIHRIPNLMVEATEGMEINSVGICPQGGADGLHILTRLDHIRNLIRCGRLPAMMMPYKNGCT